MEDVKYFKRSVVMDLMIPSLSKERKKQAKDELDRQKLADKKKRRLEKALAASAAIRLELEKKKQKKKEEEQRLDEEGAAIAESVALHVLMDENPEDSFPLMLDEGTFSVGKTVELGNEGCTMNEWDSGVSYKMCAKYSMGRGWDCDSFRSGCEQGNREVFQSLPNRYTGYDLSLSNGRSLDCRNARGASGVAMCNASSYEGGIFHVADVPGFIAAQAVASLRIADDVCLASVSAPDTGGNNHSLL